MEELLNREEQDKLIKLIEYSGLCKSNDGRSSFLIEVNLRPEENRVETEEHNFLVQLIDRLVQAKDREAIRLALKRLRQSLSASHEPEIQFLEARLGKIASRYRPSQPTAKPGYFADKVFRLMPFDIGTIWGLQRSSFIGISIGFDGAEIYKNLRNVEFVLSEASKANQGPRLPKREWIRIDISRNPTAPYQKVEILDAAIDPSPELYSILEERAGQDSSILGFLFEIDATRLDACSEQLRNWCQAILKELFPSSSTAIVINVIWLLDENVERGIEDLRKGLQEIAQEIPVEVINLDYRLFFDKNRSDGRNKYVYLVDREEKGLPFSSWVYNAKAKQEDREKYEYITGFFDRLKKENNYSEEDLKNAYNRITARDVVLDIQAIALAPDIQAIAPKELKQIYDKLLRLVVTFFPQDSCEWVGAYVESQIEEAAIAAITVANHDDFTLLSDVLMDAWVDAIKDNRLDVGVLDLLYKGGPTEQEGGAKEQESGEKESDSDSITNLKLEEGLFLALLRRKEYRNDEKVQTILQRLARGSRFLQVLYNFCIKEKEGKEEKEDNFLERNDAELFTLAIRARESLDRVIHKFKAASASHVSTEICWLLAAIPPTKQNITELLQLEARKRAVFGLCTSEEWEQLQKSRRKRDQILDCRRNRPLVFLEKAPNS